MMTILACIADDHNAWLIMLAALVCVAGSWATVRLFNRAAATRSTEKAAWLLLTATVTGAAIWCTHFVAMLGYDPGTPIGFDPVLTIISLLVAMAGAYLGFLIAALELRFAPIVGGLVVGLAIVVMHYTGMMGYRVQGLVSWDMNYLVASIIVSCGFSAAALQMLRADRGKASTYGGTALLVLAIVGLHFTGMTAFRVEPMLVDGAFSNPAALRALAIAVAGVALVIVAAGLASNMIDDHARARAADALTNMSSGLVMVSAQERITLYNRRAAEIFGLEQANMALEMKLGDFLGLIGSRAGWEPSRIRRVLNNHRVWFAKDTTTRVEQEFEDGRVVAVVCRPLPEGGAILTYEDMTEAREGQKRIAHMAYHDTLTGLANRRLFSETLATAMGPDGLALLMIDLDRFKAVNDKFGHNLGDEVLVQAAARLKALARPNSTAFRLGGDEFAIILEGEVEAARGLAHDIVAAMTAPFAIGPHIARIGCSVGIASTLAEEDPSTMQQRADLALYKAKNQGRGRVETYRDGMMEEAAERQFFEEELIHAVERGQLELYYQPLFALPGRRLKGFEALIRWNHPDRGLISPADFIPIAEACGAIERIGAWIIDEACRQVGNWPRDLYVSINVSPIQMRSPAILTQIHQALESYGLSPRQVEIEITETAMVDNSEQIAATLAGFRALGIRVAIDDFGTGYSSLAHLREFKVDRIKIDRSFVGTVGHDASADAVVRAVMGIARELSIETTAEGIETEQQLEALVKLGCGTAQGYLLGRPMTSERAGHLLEAAPSNILAFRLEANSGT
ncbi:bifunctional diguanylate cyclase/phosphodiesterase [Arsenicitalea aurantiaca]|nr:EAL domain-containing protein [Arsenicitalea aurantiaca]